MVGGAPELIYLETELLALRAVAIRYLFALLHGASCTSTLKSPRYLSTPLREPHIATTISRVLQRTRV